MTLPDWLAVATAVGALFGGFLGLVSPFRGIRDWFDNGQRGAFAGAYLGSLAGLLLDLGTV